MFTPTDPTETVSDPDSPHYDPNSPYYDVTLDSSSPFYVRPVDGDPARSGPEIREDVTSRIENDPLASELSKVERESTIQSEYSAALEDARRDLNGDVLLRPSGQAPKTRWANASHEQMIDTLNTNADSVAVAETSEEWVRLGNELAVHQRSVADAIDSSMGDWVGQGGDAARKHLTEFARWLGDTARGAELTGRQQQIHSQTLNETQKKMAANPPVDFSVKEANAALATVTDPASYAAMTSTFHAIMEEKEAARGQAARIMDQFDETVGSAVDMPVFSPPPDLAGVRSTSMMSGRHVGGGSAAPGGPGAATPTGLPGYDGETSTAPGSLTTGPAGEYASTVPGSPSTVDGMGESDVAGFENQLGGGNRAVPSGTGTVPTPGTPGVSEFSAPPTPGLARADVPGGSFDAPGSFNGPGSFDGPKSFGGPDSLNGPRSFDDLGPSGSPFGPLEDKDAQTSASSFSILDSNTTPGSTHPGAGKIPGSNWSGQGGGGAGMPAQSLGGGASGALGGGAGTGGGSAGGGAGTSGTGPNSGTGKNLGSGSNQAGTGASSVRGSGMGGMMAGGAGGAGRSEEDKEHRVAGFLGEDDELFSTEQVIAPPVIGDWSNKDWQ